MNSLSKNLALWSSTYDNYIVLGDFNAEVDNNTISSFCDVFDLANLIRLKLQKSGKTIMY